MQETFSIHKFAYMTFNFNIFSATSFSKKNASKFYVFLHFHPRKNVELQLLWKWDHIQEQLRILDGICLNLQEPISCNNGVF